MITIENYEIFYLDYLEGNLNTELTTELIEFLTLNPDLKENGDDLTTLIGTEDYYQDKTALKHFDEEEKISLSNIDAFMIADAEKILSNQKSKELSHFIKGDTQLENDQEVYAKSILIADETIQFSNKKALKRKESIALWPIVSIAAGVALVLALGNIVSTNQPNEKYMFSALNIKQELNNSEEVSIDWTIVKENSPVKATKSNSNRMQSTPQKNEVNKSENIASLPITKPTFPSFTRYNKNDLHISTENLSTNNLDLAENSVEKSESFEQMNNPIWAVTNVVGAITKTEIDFRKGKSTPRKTGGFKIKIGKFEVYKKTSKKM